MLHHDIHTLNTGQLIAFKCRGNCPKPGAKGTVIALQTNDRFEVWGDWYLNDQYWEGFRALQRTKASDAGTRVGSETELWGFVLWPGRDAAVRSGKTTEAAARDAASTIMIEVRNVDLSSFGGRVATR